MEPENKSQATGIDQIKNMFNSLDLNSKIIISSALILVVVAISLLVSYAFKPDYVLLYGGLDLKDASEIIQELDAQNITYKVRAGGKDIHVPLVDRDRMRIALAGKGFLPSAQTGYELFDKNRMTLSSFQQQVDYKRALEGELARTLISLEEVEFARVHLVIPDPSPFLEDQQEPSASVVLKLQGAMQIKSSKMAAISNLVASAVPGLDTSNVTVMDDKANMLAGGSMADGYDLQPLPNQQSYLKQFEESLKQKIKMVLEPAYGMGNITIAVSAALDFNKVEEQKTEFDPIAGSDTGILRSHDISEISTRNSPADSGGVAGATANLPSYQAASNTQDTSSKSDETTETRNYEVNEKQTTTSFAQGAIKRLSVSVLLNAEKLESSEKTSLENLVKDAVNFDTTRGDTLTVAAQIFDTTFQKEMEEARAKTVASASQTQNITYGLLILTAALLGFSLFKLMKPFKLPVSASLPGFGSAELAVETTGGSEPDIFSAQGPDAVTAKLREEVVRIAKEHPEDAARVLKTWLKE